MSMKAKMLVPFVDLRAQYRSIREEIDAAIARVLERSAFVGGEELDRFEEHFAAFCQVKHAIGVGNATDALFLALRALGIGQGDDVIVPANTFIATSEAVSATGARPVFADVEEETATLDPVALEASITPHTVAVIPVHLYGRPARMEPILEISRRHDLAVVEDAAQAHGARYQGRRVGSWGTVACISFYPAKNLGAYGDGGAVVTSNEALARRVRMLRNHGRTEKYLHEMEGFNSRLDNLQAAILDVKLQHLEGWNQRREEIAAKYRRLLSELQGVQLLAPAEPGEHVYHLYVVRLRDRDGVRKRLAEAGIATGIHYPIPLHLQPAYRDHRYREGDFPVSERLAREVLSLPMFPELAQEAQDYVIQQIRAFFEEETN